MKDTDKTAKLLIKLVEGMCHENCAILFKHPDDDRPFHRMILRPHMSEFRVLCGRGGRQIKALQHLGQIGGIQIILDESDVGDKELKHPFKLDPTFDTKVLTDLLAELTAAFIDKPIRWRAAMAFEKLIVKHDRPLDDDEADTACAISDCLFTWGFRHGALIDVKVKHPSREAQAA